MKASHFQGVHTSRFRAKKVDFSTRPVPEHANPAARRKTQPATSPAPKHPKPFLSLPCSAQTVHDPLGPTHSANHARLGLALKRATRLGSALRCANRARPGITRPTLRRTTRLPAPKRASRTQPGPPPKRASRTRPDLSPKRATRTPLPSPVPKRNSRLATELALDSHRECATPLSLRVVSAQASTRMRVRSALFFCDGSTSRA